MTERECCFIGCNGVADFIIRTVRDGGGIAGPDLYCDETDACSDHLGALIGMQPGCVNPEEIFWHVIALEAIPSC